MQVDLKKQFPIDAPASAGWAFLQDIPGVASCMPGAEITESTDEMNHIGKVKAKIGPATMAFNGTIVIKNIDAAKMELHLVGTGQDTKGTSGAEMDLTAHIVEVDGGKCELHGDATVTVTGKAASLGGRMMTQVADQILNQFGANFANNVIAMGSTDESAKAEAAEKVKEQPKELNGLAFAWSIFVGMLKNLFGGKKS